MRSFMRLTYQDAVQLNNVRFIV